MMVNPKLPIWTTPLRSSEPTTFSSALEWAKSLGDFARMGYNVIFRQPKIREFFEVTPVMTK